MSFNHCCFILLYLWSHNTLSYSHHLDRVNREKSKEQRDELDFLSRSQAEWQTRWHTDCHKRCRQELVDHIRIACEKDIYRIARDNLRPPWLINRSDVNVAGIIVSKKTAFSFLESYRGNNRVKRGIMEECCISKGCNWEEYAETCRYNSRIQAPTDSSGNMVCN